MWCEPDDESSIVTELRKSDVEVHLLAVTRIQKLCPVLYVERKKHYDKFGIQGYNRDKELSDAVKHNQDSFADE